MKPKENKSTCKRCRYYDLGMCDFWADDLMGKTEICTIFENLKEEVDPIAGKKTGHYFSKKGLSKDTRINIG